MALRFALGWLLHVVAVSGEGLQMNVKTKEEIMSHMTLDLAVKTVTGMNATADLRALIQTKFGRAKSHGLRAAVRTTPATGYAALNKAIKFLNEMGEQSGANLESEEERCRVFKEGTEADMETARQQVLYFNGGASEARGHVVDAQGCLMTTTEILQATNSDLDKLQQECADDIASLRAQLKVVLADIVVMASILKLTDCNTAMMLVQCPHCDGAVLIQHGNVQQELNKLQSSVALESVSNTLHASYDESFAQLQHGHIGKHHAKHLHRKLIPVKALNTSDVPIAPKPMECVPTNKCSIADSPNCQKLKDRFLVVQAGIVEKKDELQTQLEARESFCKKQEEQMTTSIENMETKIRDCHTNFATGTEEQNNAEKGSHTQNSLHTALATNYGNEMKKCCDNQNNYKSEVCALIKIRGELDKMEGQNTFVTDCEVTDWREDECTVTCGGGTMVKTRTIVVHPVGLGMSCPPVQAEVSCNMAPCPVDCILKDWSGWSECSAECGGGLMERARNIKTEPAFSGRPCGSTEEEEPCGIAACDANCELGDWSAWSSCSKACGGGSMRRTKYPIEAARGGGTCPEPTEESRMAFMSCNALTCTEKLEGTGRDILRCTSKVDMMVLLDGSGSLGQYGWQQSVKMARDLVKNLNGEGDRVRISFMVFSGPSTWDAYERCTGELGEGQTVDMKEDCGIDWVVHNYTDMMGLKDKIRELVFPAATTLTSVALGQAEAETKYGREDANTVVIVITDGKPMNQGATISAARNLQEKARVIWVPVGAGAPMELIEQVASKPYEDHIVSISSFELMSSPFFLNKVITDACPIVE